VLSKPLADSFAVGRRQKETVQTVTLLPKEDEESTFGSVDPKLRPAADSGRGSSSSCKQIGLVVLQELLVLRGAIRHIALFI
jgi:hypothetical protein